VEASWRGSESAVSRESLLETLQPGPPPPVRITPHYRPLSIPIHISRRRGPHAVAFASFFPTALPRRHGEPLLTRARPVGRADAILGGEQRCRTQVAARNKWLRGKRLDRSITNTAIMIGRYEHITFVAVSRSESDEADRPRRRLSASVFFVLSALTALPRTLSMPSSGPSKRPKNLKKSQCGLQWLCVSPAGHGDWLARLLAATNSRYFDVGLSNSQSDFISTLCRRLFLPSLRKRNFLEVGNT